MTPIDAAARYYDAFRKKTDFSEVPMAEDLVFRGPSGGIEGAAPFRTVLTGLAQQVKGLEIRHQAADGDAVLTVYDFDLGLPDGPIPMAEVVRIRGGELAEVELLFDSQRLPGSAG